MKHRLFDLLEQKCSPDIDHSQIGLAYELFEIFFKFEYYLCALPNKDSITFLDEEGTQWKLEDVIESNDKIDLVIDVNTQMNSIICFNYVEKV